MKLDELSGPADWSNFAHPIEEIGTDGDNPNEMPDEMYSELVDNIHEYGWVGGPLLVKPTPPEAEEIDESYVVSDGEHRLKAAHDIGLEGVLVIIGEDWSEADRRLLRQRMNKVAGEHDAKRDALEFDWLAQHGKQDEVLDLLDARGESFDEYMDMIKARPRRAMDRNLDLDINVHYEDCVQGMRDRLGDNSVDMVFTSPPSPVELDPNETQGPPRDVVTYSDDRDQSEYQEFIGDVLEELARVTKPTGHVFINLQVDTREGTITPPTWVADAMPLPWRSYVIWNKPGMPPGTTPPQEPGRFVQNWEPILHFSEAPTRLDGTPNLAVWDVKPSTYEHEHDTGVHPAPFPVALVEEALTPTTAPGDLILDPFMGSGTTAVAAILNDREYVGFELDEQGAYKPIIERRVRDALRQQGASVNEADEEAADTDTEADGDPERPPEEVADA